MSELRIHTQINSRYRAFDFSGRLPFSIVFGFCRRAKDDVNPKPLLLEIAGSVLDVPYALAQGLLTLQEKGDPDVTPWIDVDLSRLSNVTPKEAGCLSIPSPVSRTEHWRRSFTLYQCQLQVNDELASILQPGVTYRIVLASKDLGVKRWAYTEATEHSMRDADLGHNPEPAKLINLKSTASNARFKVFENLPWPPEVVTKMSLCASSSLHDPVPAGASDKVHTVLEVSATNTGDNAVTVQTKGHQPVLYPCGIWDSETDVGEHLMRIIQPTSNGAPTSSLRVIDVPTGAVVRGGDPPFICTLRDSNADTRPKAGDLLILKPGEPVVRLLDIGRLTKDLSNGQYQIRMRPRGCRWWEGDVIKELDEGGRLPPRLCRAMIPPLMLETQDEANFRVKDGEILY